MAAGPAARGGSKCVQPVGGPGPGAGRIRTGGPSLGASSFSIDIGRPPTGARRGSARASSCCWSSIRGRIGPLPSTSTSSPSARSSPCWPDATSGWAETRLGMGGGGPHVRRRRRHLPGGAGPRRPGDQPAHPPQRARAGRRRRRLAGRGGTGPLRKGIEPVGRIRLPHRSHHRKRTRRGCRGRRCLGRPPQRAPSHPVATHVQHVPVRRRSRGAGRRLTARPGRRAGGAGPQRPEPNGDLRLPCRRIPELLRGHVRRRRFRPAGDLAGPLGPGSDCG